MGEESWEKERTKLEKLVGALSYFSLIPFVALSMMGYFKAGVISAIVLALVFAVIASKFGNLKTIDVVFPCFFAGCGISLLFPVAGIILEKYISSLLWSALALMAFVSLIIRNPFTLQHAKEQVIEAVWDAPAFISGNYILTWIFAAVFAINAVISAVWGFYSLAMHVVCFALLFVAIAFTKVLPKYYVPYYMRKYGEKAKPKDLSKLPLRLIFEGMVTGFNAKEAKRWSTVIQYNITGKSGGKFYVEIKDQKCKLEAGEAANPKLIITASREDWVAIAEGKLEGQKAFREGKMKVDGDMNELFRMQEVFQTGR